MPKENTFFTFADLKSGNFPRGDGKKFAVFGYPVRHSLSPAMQNAALAEIAKSDADFEGAKYLAFEIAPDELKEALDILACEKFVGINLTIPHKIAPLSFLKNIDPYVLEAGACNTLFNDGGNWHAFNTDGFGLECAIEKLFGVSVAGRDVYIAGAGGAARGIAFWLAKKNPRNLFVSNRSADRLSALLKDLTKAGVKCAARAPVGKDFCAEENSVIINATSIGLKETDQSIIDFSRVPKSCIFFDMPYSKGRETRSVIEARAAGIRANSGLAMLAYQGAKSLQIWTGKPPLGDFMFEKLKGIFAEK